METQIFKTTVDFVDTKQKEEEYQILQRYGIELKIAYHKRARTGGPMETQFTSQVETHPRVETRVSTGLKHCVSMGPPFGY